MKRAIALTVPLLIFVAVLVPGIAAESRSHSSPARALTLAP